MLLMLPKALPIFPHSTRDPVAEKPPFADSMLMLAGSHFPTRVSQTAKTKQKGNKAKGGEVVATECTPFLPPVKDGNNLPLGQYWYDVLFRGGLSFGCSESPARGPTPFDPCPILSERPTIASRPDPSNIDSRPRESSTWRSCAESAKPCILIAQNAREHQQIGTSQDDVGTHLR